MSKKIVSGLFLSLLFNLSYANTLFNENINMDLPKVNVSTEIIETSIDTNTKIKKLKLENKEIEGFADLSLVIPTGGSLFNDIASNFTVSASGFSSSDQAAALDARGELVSSLYYVVTTFALLLGLGLMVVGILKLKRRAENPNDARSFPAAIIITILSGAMIFNYSTTSGTLITTLLGDGSGHCFILQEELGSNNLDINESNCWDKDSSDNLNEIADKIEAMTDGNGDAFKKNVEIILAFFQVIGMIYLFKGIYGLKEASEGNGKDGYMKPIVIMIASALVIDLPHTLEVIENTLVILGFGGKS